MSGKNPAQDTEESPSTTTHRFVGGLDFLKDDPTRMTFGRQLALFLAKRSKWYNPRLGEDDDEDGVSDNLKPSIEKAWAYFEHVTLQRYLDDRSDRSVANDENAKGICGLFQPPRAQKIAEPGDKENETKLYSPLSTPLTQLGDFGLGYGVYFGTLRSIALLSFLLGIINIPSLLYFAGSEYSGDKDGVSGILRASAICTDQSWVPCPNCKEEQFATFPSGYPVPRTIFGAVEFTAQENGDWLNITEFLVSSSDSDTLTIDEEFALDTFGDLDISSSIKCSSRPLGGCFVPVTGFNADGDSQIQTVNGGFALRHNCGGATLRQGFVNYASLIVALVGAVVIYRMNNRMEVAFDEDEQTSADYSVLVKNPPRDAYDPEEWKSFFEETFDANVAVCTVNVDNDVLTNALVQRRDLLRKIELALPVDYLSVGSSEGLALLGARIKEERHPFDRLKARFLSPGIPELLEQVRKTTEIVKQEAASNKSVSAVFVTFETETAQRKVLSKLSTGVVSMKTRYPFRGSHILKVEEPEEPSTIRWQELGTSELTLLRQVTLSTISSVIAILVACALIQMSYSSPFPPLGAITTTIATTVYPGVVQFSTRRESHPSETEIQKWLYIKIALFNVVTTAVYLQIATPFTATLDASEGSVPGLITSVHRLFISQLLITPGLQLLDPAGHFNRHILAPRAKTQAAMNNLMKGQKIDLSMRYGNMTKFVFLMFWYCAIYPPAFFLGAFALYIAYYVDRFCLMRTWGRAPHVGTDIAHFARDYVFPFAVAAMAVMRLRGVVSPTIIFVLTQSLSTENSTKETGNLRSLVQRREWLASLYSLFRESSRTSLSLKTKMPIASVTKTFV